MNNALRPVPGTSLLQDMQALPSMDPSRLTSLLEMAGPELRDELLDRLALDLLSVQEVLSEAVPMLDWDALRAQTHVLIALAGAAGASRLQWLAESLNAAAHQLDAVRADALHTLMGEPLDMLIALIRAHRLGLDP